jgi:hypothetical protein
MVTDVYHQYQVVASSSTEEEARKTPRPHVPRHSEALLPLYSPRSSRLTKYPSHLINLRQHLCHEHHPSRSPLYNIQILHSSTPTYPTLHIHPPSPPHLLQHQPLLASSTPPTPSHPFPPPLCSLCSPWTPYSQHPATARPPPLSRPRSQYTGSPSQRVGLGTRCEARQQTGSLEGRTEILARVRIRLRG